MAVPDDSESLIDAMADTLDTLLSVVWAVADEYGGDFADPSPARTDWTTCDMECGLDLEQAYRTGMVLFHAIQDHGRGLTDLIRSRRTYSSMTLARSLAEGSARSWFMLEPNDVVDPLERVRRLINERLYADHENTLLYNGLLPSLGMKTDVEQVAKAKEAVTRDRIEQVRKDREALLNSARAYALFPIKEPKRDAAFVGGFPRPPAMTLIGRLIDSASQGDSFFRSSSSIAHYSLHGQVRMINFSRTEDGKDLTRVRPMNSDDLAASVWPSVAAFALVTQALFRQAGWQTEALDDAVANLAVAWNPPPSDELRDEYLALT